MTRFLATLILTLVFMYYGIWVPVQLIRSGDWIDILIGIIWGVLFWAISGYVYFMYGVKR